MSKTEKQKTGAWGEEKASLFLIQQGYEIIERNYGIREGEVDIIAWDRSGEYPVLSFVEVKARSFGHDSAERAIGRGKMKRVKKAAIDFCQKQNIDTGSIWIKVELVSVYFEVGDEKIELKKYIVPSWLFD